MNTSKEPSHSASYAEQFQALDHWLARFKPLWDVQSFHSLDWPWRAYSPELCNWLQNYQGDPSEADVERALRQYVPDFDVFIFDWQSLPYNILPSPPSHFNAGVKGRKWQQINAFSSAINPISPTLEWCSGKGHLGKLLSYQHQLEIHSLEWQASLCLAGQEEAERRHLPQQFIHADVLKGEGKEPLQHVESAVALHACGDLHTTLIEQAIEAELNYLAISPCCYHLTTQMEYRPLSKLAQQAKIRLTRDNLKLAVKEVATAGLREQRLKQLELVYRLGFDAWQRQATGNDQYLNVPSCSKSLLIKGFDAFVRWAAGQKSLEPLLLKHSLAGFEDVGLERCQRVAKVEAVSQYFRRPLELWLALDRVIRLEEAGYQVTLGEFCEKSLTPRNLLICAQR